MPPACPHYAQTYDAQTYDALPLPAPPSPPCLQIYCIQCQAGYEFNDTYKVRASNAAALLPMPLLARALQSAGEGCWVR